MVDEQAYQKELEQRDERQHAYERVVSDAVKRVLASIRWSRPRVVHHLFYGAMGIHPKHLVIWYFFSTDDDYFRAKRKGTFETLRTKTLAQLQEAGYPAEVLPQIHIKFESKETVNSKGGWKFFK